MKVRIVCHIDRILEVENDEDILEKALRMTPAENFYWQPCSNDHTLQLINADRTQKDEIDFPCGE